MSVSKRVYDVVFWSIILIVLLIGGSYVLGSPIIFGYTETDSMDPSISPEDGYVAVPESFVGGIDDGDIIVYESTTIGEEELTVHRVVERGENGYVTKGDNNPVTDQDEGEPPVSDSRVRGVVPTVGDMAISSNVFGYVFQSVHRVSSSVGEWVSDRGIVVTQTASVVLISSVVLVLFAVSVPEINDRVTGRDIQRNSTFSPWVIFGVILIAFILPLMTGMLVPSQTNDLRILVTEDTTNADEMMFAAGEDGEIEFDVSHSTIPKVIIFNSPSDGVEFEPQTVIATSTHGNQTVAANIQVPDETGWYDRPRVEYHYYLVLPPSVIAFLHSIHPIVALIAVTSVLVMPIAVFGILFFGGGQVYLREVNR